MVDVGQPARDQANPLRQALAGEQLAVLAEAVHPEGHVGLHIAPGSDPQQTLNRVVLEMALPLVQCNGRRIFADYLLPGALQQYLVALVRRKPGGDMLEGWLARMFYISLYRMHQIALYGMPRTLLMMLGDKLSRSTEPRLKLH